MSHTPSPWVRRTPTVIATDSRDIAIIVLKPNPAEAGANARLIAAAPDLLAALEAAEGVVDWALDNGAHPGARAVHSLILAAIARAKGQS